MYPDRSIDDMLADLDDLAMTHDAPNPLSEKALNAMDSLLGLYNAVHTPVRVDRPQDLLPRPVIAHPITLEQVDALNARVAEADADVFQYLIKDGRIDLSGGRLAAAIEAVKSLYEKLDTTVESVGATGEVGAIAVEMFQDRAKPARLGQLLGIPDLDLPLPQAAGLLRFLDTYPQFLPNLHNRISRIRFNSRRADSRGGGVFNLDKDLAIDMSTLLGTPPGAFVRLFVHETGHATFEAALLNNRSMPVELDKGELPDLPTLPGLSHLVDPSRPGVQNAPTGADPLPGRGERYQEMLVFWNGMTPAARAYYRAWLTLRQEHGAHLLGLDLWRDPRGNRLSPHQRLGYQAGNFGEFCAETFMQYAMGDLHAHVRAILAGHVEPAVKIAWRDAWIVLEKVAAPILGNRIG